MNTVNTMSTINTMTTISENQSRSPPAGRTPFRLFPGERSVTHSNTSSRSNRKSICGTLPPPHNPNNPDDPVRRSSLMNLNRTQLNLYLRVGDTESERKSNHGIHGGIDD